MPQVMMPSQLPPLPLAWLMPAAADLGPACAPRRRIPTLQIAAGRARKAGIAPPASWLDGSVQKASMMDPDTAQVTPYELTVKLMDAAVAGGARVQIGAGAERWRRHCW